MGTEESAGDERRRAESAGPYTFLPAAPALPGVVASTVGYHAAGQQVGVHRGLPSPHLTFIISLDEPIRTGASPEHLASPQAHRNDVLIAGLHTAPAYVRRSSQEAGIQVALHPLSARALLGAPARELVPLTVEGADLLGPDILRLREQLLETDDWPRRFDLLAGYLRARMDAADHTAQVRSEVAEAWTWMARHRGAGSMRGLGEHVALSQRQLRTLFEREVGRSPKVISRLMRFSHASGQIAASVGSARRPSLVEVAHRCGYYDQAHLAGEFREFTGASPTGWISEELRNIQAGGHRGGADSDL